MTIRSRRHLSGTLAWASTLAALVLASSLLTEALRETPNHVLVTLAILAFTAAACGVVLNWR
ncbi:MAG: hypothetical protein ABWY51_00770, partial [Gaiellaceae bacterium]